MQIDVTIPGMLLDCTGGQRHVSVDATTIQSALDALLTAYPLLRVHLYDEQSQVRKHVLIFYNDENIKRMPRLDVPLKPTDRLHIVQAVSGG